GNGISQEGGSRGGRGDLKPNRRAWDATATDARDDAVLMGLPLAQASYWLSRRAADISEADRRFIVLSRKAAQRRRRRAQTLVGVPTFGSALALLGWLNQSYLQERINWFTTMRPYMFAQVRPYVLAPQAERELIPKDSFRECAKDCPEMIVIPKGEFMIGSAEDENGRFTNEGPQRRVMFGKSF